MNINAQHTQTQTHRHTQRDNHTDTNTQTHTQTQSHRQAPVGSHAVKLVSKTAADKVEISLHWKLHTASHVKQTVTVDLLSNYDRWDFSLAGPATWNWL